MHLVEDSISLPQNEIFIWVRNGVSNGLDIIKSKSFKNSKY
jgi:hypothetical protein